ncbi:MAG: DASS family sodium-coupled anion symporter [Spirochaetota bacterium]
MAEAAAQGPGKRGLGLGAKLIALAAAALVLGLLLSLPLPESIRVVRGVALDEKGHRALAVLAAALVLWITEALPFHVTGLAAMLALAFVGGGDFRTIVKTGFGDDIVVFFIGVLALAASIVRSGLGRRISLFVLSLTGNSTRAVIFGFLAAGALISMWVTALAASAMLMPLALGVLKEEGAEPGKSRFGAGLMLAVAYGALVGAVGTPAGSGSNPVVVKFLSQLAGYEISFTGWMALGIPVALILAPMAWLVIIMLFPPESKRLKKTKEELTATFRAQVPMSRDERAVLVVFALTVLIWVVSPFLEGQIHMKLPISMAALGALVLLFVPGVTTFKWKEIEREMDWSGIILIAAGIGLGTTLYDSGAAAWLAAIVFGGIGAFPLFWRLALVTLGVLVVKVALSSNTLTGTIIVPLILALAPSLGVTTPGLALAAGFAANLAVILVTTSPVNIVPYSTGYFTIADMAKAGLVFAPFAALVIALVFRFLGPLLGVFPL